MGSRSVLHYQLLEKIGAGGMGAVYKAQDSRLERFVAVKLLHEGKSGSTAEQRRRFVQEARAASALNHPNIITIHDIVSDGEDECIVMEYIGGKSLLDVIPNGGLRVPQVLEYAVQIADALSAAHSAGIIHRDLKPGNVMITGSGLVKVLDFGLAKVIDSNPVTQLDDTVTVNGPPLTMEGSFIGTVSYSSPEQAQGKKVDTRSDIFSFGAMLYEMVTGRRAFEGESSIDILTAVLRDEPKPIAEIAPEVPPQIERIVNRCLLKDPDARWQSMKEVETELAVLKGQSDSGRLYQSLVVPASPRRSRKPVAFAVIGVAIVLAAVGGWWRWGRHRSEQQIAQPVAQAPAAPVIAPPVPVDSALTNDSVVEMVQAKAPVSVILGQIRSAKTNFTLSTAEVIRLVKAGVPENVIEVMRDPKRVPSPASSPAIPAAETAPPAAGTRPPSASPSTPVLIGDALPFPIALDEDIPIDAEEGRPLRFTAAADLRVGGAVIIAKSAPVTGEIAEVGKKKFLGRRNKLSFRLLKADSLDGQTLKVRATPAPGAPGPSRRPVENGKGAKAKDLAASRGTRYLGYIDGDQTVSVRPSQ